MVLVVEDTAGMHRLDVGRLCQFAGPRQDGVGGALMHVQTDHDALECTHWLAPRLTGLTKANVTPRRHPCEGTNRYNGAPV